MRTCPGTRADDLTTSPQYVSVIVLGLVTVTVLIHADIGPWELRPSW